MVEVDIKRAGYEDGETTISDINFNLLNGELVGLIGSNGAGKSSTIKSIMGTIPFLDGNVQQPEGETQTYVPEHPSFYDYLTLREHIRLIASLYNIPQKTWEERASHLLELFNLNPFLDEYPTNFSKGMKQKAMLIFSFITQADFFLIDEPFIGLDPKATKDLLNLIQNEKKRGACILMCTHVLDTAERYCDKFVLIHEGKMLLEGNLLDIRKKAGIRDGTLLDCFYKIQENEADSV